MLDIYYFEDIPTYLGYIWESKKLKNPQLSLRAWAKHLGFSNHTSLSFILKNQRTIPKKNVQNFVSSLDLNEKEAMYFEALCDLHKVKKEEDKGFYLERIKKLRPGKFAIDLKEVQEFVALKSVLHCILLEIIDLKDFIYDYQWIQKRLAFKYTQFEIRQSFERLIELGMLNLDDNGNPTRVFDHVTTESDLVSKATREYHKESCDLAKEAVDTQLVTEREFNGTSLRIKKSDIPKAKTMLREFMREFIHQIETEPENSEEIYQLNLHLFSLTKEKEVQQ